MELDLDNIDQVLDRITVPAGTYVCSIGQIRERHTRAGDPLWGLRLIVEEGQFTGHTAAWDNLVFSDRGLNRVKSVLKAFGLPCDGKVELTTGDLLERRALVEVRPSEYHSPEGQMTRRNEVPYEGYRPLLETSSSARTDTSGTPPAHTAPKRAVDPAKDEIPF